MHRQRLLHRAHPLRNLLLAHLPQLPRIPDPEPMLEDLGDLLERQAGDLGVEEDDEDPADAADGGVEAEGAAGRHALHHGEEGGGDDDVAAPA